MSPSKREIPHYYLSLSLDVTPAVDWLAASNAAKPVTERLLLAALLVKAVALACREIPAFSGFYRDGRYETSLVGSRRRRRGPPRRRTRRAGRHGHRGEAAGTTDGGLLRYRDARAGRSPARE